MPLAVFNDTMTVRSNARYLHAEGIYRTVYTNSAGNGYIDPAATMLRLEVVMTGRAR